MRTKISDGKGGWVVQFEGESQFHIFRADDALRLVRTLCTKALNVNLDDILAQRQAQIVAERAAMDSGTESYK